jgi:glyoxylase-like metal-dependent hydrolase (beta-lactamase superfamily II)
MTEPERDPLSWKIGDVRITRLVELKTSTLGAHLLPDASPEALAPYAWLRPFLDDQNRLVLSIHCLVIETSDRLIVVDTCIGNDKVRSYPAWNLIQTDFLTRFEAAGFELDRVDTVLCTHLHVDHVGWNTRLVDGRWRPTFPNARYLYAEKEWSHARVEPQEFGPLLDDSVQPIFDAGLADLVSSEHRVAPEIALTPTEGHTPGHVSILIDSGGEQAVITGDMMHHPCQIPQPVWSIIDEVDAVASA